MTAESPRTLHATVVDNGVRGLRSAYADLAPFAVDFAQTSDPDFVRLSSTDLLVVPNGSDHVAMQTAARGVEALLERGGGLICADGWFTPWVPGHQWRHSNRYPTKDVRYRIRSDRHGLFAGLDLDRINFRHGVSGWWACGYIDAHPDAEVLLEDTWGRPVLVLDEVSTPGALLLSASGPLAEISGELGSDHPLSELWRRVRSHFAQIVPERERRAAVPVDASEGSDVSALQSGLFPARIARRAAPRIGLLFNGVWSHWAFARSQKYRPHYRLLYVQDLEESDLAGLEALVVPFQMSVPAMTRIAPWLEAFCRRGGRLVVFGDAELPWLGCKWVDRPVDNYWWKTNPDHPPVRDTDHRHPLYSQLQPRHAGWHHHGAFRSIPSGARVIQRNREKEPITWQHAVGDGFVFASTKDPIVEHAVQQIRHLDRYCDALTEWLTGVRPSGVFVPPETGSPHAQN